MASVVFDHALKALHYKIIFLKILCFFKFLSDFILYIFASFGTSFDVRGEVSTQFDFFSPSRYLVVTIAFHEYCLPR